MAYTAIHWVAVGGFVKASDSEKHFDNAQFLRGDVLGVDTALATNTAINPTFRKDLVNGVEDTTGALLFSGGTSTTTGAVLQLSGETDSIKSLFTGIYGDSANVAGTSKMQFTQRHSGGANVALEIDNDAVQLGTDGSNAQLPMSPSSSTQKLILQGALSGPAGGGTITLFSDTDGNGNVIRASGTDTMLHHDSGDNQRILWDMTSTSEVRLRTRDTSSAVNDLFIDADTIRLRHGEANTQYLEFDPRLAGETTVAQIHAIGSDLLSFRSGTNQLRVPTRTAIPTESLGDGNFVVLDDSGGAIGTPAATYNLGIYIDGAWRWTALA